MQKIICYLSILIFSISSIYAQNDTILVDFGAALSPAPWNNVTSQTSGQVNGLLNHYGLTTSYNVEVHDAFNGINYSGTQMPDPALGIPSSASEESFYGNMLPFGGQTVPTGGIKFTGLLPNKPYTVELFASRTASDNRETKYTLTGQTVDSLFLNVASNTSTIVSTTLYPAADSTIEVIATAGPNNNNTYGFFYLGAAKLIYAYEPPTGPVSLDLGTPDGGEYWQVGKTASIQWQSQNTGLALLEYSYDNGTTWTMIDSLFSAQQQYDWVVPNTPSTQCLVRLTADTLIDTSNATFEISTDTTSCRIVVLGSSTAAGVGPSSPDSTWVNRYRTDLVSDTRLEVINLARGGYTTYHILPTGTTIPPGINITIDTLRNLTKALSYDPVAIIVNMPSNDAANNFGVSQQLGNFDLLYTSAQSVGVDSWICTTQPRNGFSTSQVQIQEEVKDSILAIYGSNSLDFWNGFASSNGFLLPAYDSGDGVHMNDAGHRILFERVFAKQIGVQTCNPIILDVEELEGVDSPIYVYPNPSEGSFYLIVNAEKAGIVSVDCFDGLGRLVYEMERPVVSGIQEIQVSLPDVIASGVFYLRVGMENKVYGVPVMLNY